METRSLIPILPRTLTGFGSPVGNAGALDWSLGGWLAYGVNAFVQILDPGSTRGIQVLERHRSPVRLLAWAKAHFFTDKTRTAHLHCLASADSSGHIFIWDVLSGEVKASFSESSSSSVSAMKWLDGSVENTGHYLLSLHPPYSIHLWDTTNGSLVWKKELAECGLLKNFDVDPFHPCRIVFLSSHSLLFIEDFNVSKAPGNQGDSPMHLKDFHLPRRSYSVSSKNSRIRRFVHEMVTLTDAPLPEDEADTTCILLAFHPHLPRHLFLLFPREIFLLDLDLGQPVGSFAERGLLSSIIPCRTRDAFYVLQDNGCVTLRTRKSGEFSTTADDIHYDSRASSESLRLSKGAKVLGFSMNLNTEDSVAIVTSEGRVFFSRLQDYSEDRKASLGGTLRTLVDPYYSQSPIRSLKLNTLSIHSGLSHAPIIIRMCPPLTAKNWAAYRPLMAGASAVQGSGTIQLYDLGSGIVEKEYAVHTFPIRGMEWSGMTSILSYAYQGLSGENSQHLVRNELIHTDIQSGESKAIRAYRSDESPIEMLRVSHLKQYFLLTFASAPLELWDLRTMTHLTTMLKRFPPITALEWSPFHNLKSIKKKIAEGSVESKDLSAKEHFIFTDPEGQLYKLNVESNVIRGLTKHPPVNGLGTVTCITWKNDCIIRGDSEGNMSLLNVQQGVSKLCQTHRGLIKKLRFAPGRGNSKLFVLHFDCVSLWDISSNEFELLGELKSPRDTPKILDIEWAASDRPVISTADGVVQILNESLSSGCSSPLDQIRLKLFSPSLLPNPAKRADFKVCLTHQPWRKEEPFSYDHHCDSLKVQFDLLDPELKVALLNCDSQLDRSWVAATRGRLCLGESLWERDFWTVAYWSLRKKGELDIGYDVLSDHFVPYSIDRLRFHLSKSKESSKKRAIIDSLLCLKEQPQEAVKSLLEIHPAELVDNLKACLVLSLQDSVSTATQSTMKLVATNLISEGKLWEGVNLLCLIGKVLKACIYLQSSNEWEASLWLGRARLETPDYKKLVLKYCDHCLAHHRRRRALLLYLSLGEFVMALDALYSGKMIPLAAKFLQVLEEEKVLPDSSHALVLTEDICLAYARYLFDIKNIDGAYFYCDKADEKGEILRREFDVLLSKNT